MASAAESSAQGWSEQECAGHPLVPQVRHDAGSDRSCNRGQDAGTPGWQWRAKCGRVEAHPKAREFHQEVGATPTKIEGVCPCSRGAMADLPGRDEASLRPAEAELLCRHPEVGTRTSRSSTRTTEGHQGPEDPCLRWCCGDTGACGSCDDRRGPCIVESVDGEHRGWPDWDYNREFGIVGWMASEDLCEHGWPRQPHLGQSEGPTPAVVGSSGDCVLFDDTPKAEDDGLATYPDAWPSTPTSYLYFATWATSASQDRTSSTFLCGAPGCFRGDGSLHAVAFSTNHWDITGCDCRCYSKSGQSPYYPIAKHYETYQDEPGQCWQAAFCEGCCSGCEERPPAHHTAEEDHWGADPGEARWGQDEADVCEHHAAEHYPRRRLGGDRSRGGLSGALDHGVTDTGCPLHGQQQFPGGCGFSGTTLSCFDSFVPPGWATVVVDSSAGVGCVLSTLGCFLEFDVLHFLYSSHGHVSSLYSAGLFWQTLLAHIAIEGSFYFFYICLSFGMPFAFPSNAVLLMGIWKATLTGCFHGRCCLGAQCYMERFLGQGATWMFPILSADFPGRPVGVCYPALESLALSDAGGEQTFLRRTFRSLGGTGVTAVDAVVFSTCHVDAYQFCDGSTDIWAARRFAVFCSGLPLSRSFMHTNADNPCGFSACRRPMDALRWSVVAEQQPDVSCSRLPLSRFLVHTNADNDCGFSACRRHVDAVRWSVVAELQPAGHSREIVMSWMLLIADWLEIFSRTAWLFSLIGLLRLLLFGVPLKGGDVNWDGPLRSF